MSTKKQIPDNDGIYFIPFTCYKWLPLFEQAKSYDVVYKWFDHLKSKGHHAIGYVTMPNHLHALLAFTHADVSINAIVGNGKRFMADEIVKRLTREKHTELLEQLTDGVSARDYKGENFTKCRNHRLIGKSAGATGSLIRNWNICMTTLAVGCGI